MRGRPSVPVVRAVCHRVATIILGTGLTTRAGTGWDQIGMSGPVESLVARMVAQRDLLRDIDAVSPRFPPKSPAPTDRCASRSTLWEP